MIERSADRIRDFAELQSSCSPCRTEVTDTGITIGHDIVPLESAAAAPAEIPRLPAR